MFASVTECDDVSTQTWRPQTEGIEPSVFSLRRQDGSSASLVFRFALHAAFSDFHGVMSRTWTCGGAFPLVVCRFVATRTSMQERVLAYGGVNLAKGASQCQL